MEFDFSKLKGRIIEICGTQGNFAKAMNLSERTISLRLKGKRPWRQNDITKAIEVLNIPVDEIQEYFFKVKVQSSEP